MTVKLTRRITCDVLQHFDEGMNLVSQQVQSEGKPTYYNIDGAHAMTPCPEPRAPIKLTDAETLRPRAHVHKPDAYDRAVRQTAAVGDPEFVSSIRCHACRKLHPVDGTEFITIRGNVYVGLQGGVIGDNYSEAGELERLTYLCRNFKCLGDLMLSALEDKHRQLYKSLYATDTLSTSQT